MKLIKHFCLSFCFLFFVFNIDAQTTTETNYILHTVAHGETMNVLAKKMHTTSAAIRLLNHLGAKSYLTVGEVVKIPAHKNGVADTVAFNRNIPGTLIPVTHIVGKGESLYTLSKKYHTTIPQLKTWNKLKSNVIVDGHTLIVGYAGTTNAMKPVIANMQPQVEVLPKQEAVAPQTQTAVENTPSASETTNTMQTTTVNQPTTTPAVQAQPEVPSADMSNIPAIGFFASSFGLGTEGRSLQTATGTSMTFKTTSGWNDKKYYILINNVPPGSIVRVTSSDNKIIYAKVLWSMEGIKENEGLDYRISTAAAAALGLSDAKFPLTVTFYE
jgi:LysM repeat protein